MAVVVVVVVIVVVAVAVAAAAAAAPSSSSSSSRFTPPQVRPSPQRALRPRRGGHRVANLSLRRHHRAGHEHLAAPPDGTGASVVRGGVQARAPPPGISSPRYSRSGTSMPHTPRRERWGPHPALPGIHPRTYPSSWYPLPSSRYPLPSSRYPHPSPGIHPYPPRPPRYPPPSPRYRHGALSDLYLLDLGAETFSRTR